MLAALALALTAGCGGEPAAPGMQIRFERAELLADADLLAIYFFAGDRTCSGLRQTQPRPSSVLGPFRVDLEPEGRERGIVFRLEDIPEGRYVVFVDALNDDGALVGAGCAPDQAVFEGETARIKVVITAP